ncbi:stabilizer of axonemal microtubules 1 isoform X1 [Hydra vulgaris]|uniref:Stabilizer of axonemal microtubules 1 isoform X1 n=1 Tax=Hydra vulgaris TaxID=6087 RepID=A0ABM4BGT3_HYDVU
MAKTKNMGTGKLVCICQICTCGRHHCIHRTNSEIKVNGPCALTEYRDTFRKFSGYQPEAPFKPINATSLSDQPFDGVSTYSKEYIPHAIVPRLKKEPAKFVKIPGDFEGLSSYKQDYFEKFPEKVMSSKPQYNYISHNEPFNDTTVNKETYKAWDLQTNTAFRPLESIKFSTSKFNHKTTFQHDFPSHLGYLGRDPLKIPESALSLPTGKFANETTSKVDYSPKDVRPEKSAKPPQHVTQCKEPFDHQTTTQHSFKWLDGKPALTCRPNQMTLMSRDPLDTETTNNTTYKPWSIQKRKKWMPQVGWTASSVPFNHETTFQHDYTKKHIDPTKSARPNYVRLQPGSFDGLTTHKDAFKSWAINPRESMRPAEGYKGPSGNFDGRTTFQTDFTGCKTDRQNLILPKPDNISFTGPQEFSTVYKDTFRGETLSPCPAKYLETNINKPSVNGYIYTSERNGHQYFKVLDRSMSTPDISMQKQMEIVTF